MYLFILSRLISFSRGITRNCEGLGQCNTKENGERQEWLAKKWNMWRFIYQF